MLEQIVERTLEKIEVFPSWKEANSQTKGADYEFARENKLTVSLALFSKSLNTQIDTHFDSLNSPRASHETRAIAAKLFEARDKILDLKQSISDDLKGGNITRNINTDRPIYFTDTAIEGISHRMAVEIMNDKKEELTFSVPKYWFFNEVYRVTEPQVKVL